MELSHTGKIGVASEAPMASFMSQFDYVLIFSAIDKANVSLQPPEKGDKLDKPPLYQSRIFRACIFDMIKAGLQVYPYLSVQEDEYIVLVRAPDDVLARFADKINFKIQLEPSTLERIMKDGLNDPEKPEKVLVEKNTQISSTVQLGGKSFDITRFNPFQYIYGKVEFEALDPSRVVPATGINPFDVYIKKTEAEKLFDPSYFHRQVRLKLLYYLLKAPYDQGGCNMEINHLLLQNKDLTDFFPLHDRQYLALISKKASFALPWRMPMDDIREYFGEKIALFFVFNGHYSYWMLVPAAIGLIFQAIVWNSNNYCHPVLAFFSIVITIWSIIMLEFWKREEAFTALKWGMLDFEDEEPDRPEFIGVEIPSYIDGTQMRYYPTGERIKRYFESWNVVTVFSLLVVSVVTGIYILKNNVLPKIGISKNSAGFTASVLNAISIQIFNLVYQIVAVKLTDAENHRTDTVYEDHLIAKTFVFQFINSYSSFFYIAFVAMNLPSDGTVHDQFGLCGDVNCMRPLMINLVIIFGTRIVVNNILDLVYPLFYFKQKRDAETSEKWNHNESNSNDGEAVVTVHRKGLTQAEEDFILLGYDSMQNSIYQFADIATTFGFLSMFVTALPIAPCFTLVNNTIRAHLFNYNLKTFYQRPVPLGAQDIGTWQDILVIISVLAVVTNAGLVCFTMQNSNNVPLFPLTWSTQDRLWVFIGYQWVLISMQFLLSIMIPDEPEEVTIQRKRQKFFSERLIDHVALEEDNLILDLGKCDEDNLKEAMKNRSSVASHLSMSMKMRREDDCCAPIDCAPVACEPCCQSAGCGTPRNNIHTRRAPEDRAVRVGKFPIYCWPENPDSNFPQLLDRSNVKAKCENIDRLGNFIVANENSTFVPLQHDTMGSMSAVQSPMTSKISPVSAPSAPPPPPQVYSSAPVQSAPSAPPAPPSYTAPSALSAPSAVSSPSAVPAPSAPPSAPATVTYNNPAYSAIPGPPPPPPPPSHTTRHSGIQPHSSGEAIAAVSGAPRSNPLQHPHYESHHDN